MSIFKYLSVLLLFLALPFLSEGQKIEYGLKLDTNYMMIGDQQKLVFQLRSGAEVKVFFPQLRDTVIRGVEILSGPVRDSVKEKDGSWLWQEEYVITAFDTGTYIIPPMPVKVEGREYDNVLRTDPVGFVVNTYDVDMQKGNYDIVMPYDAPWTFGEILPYVLWVLLGIAVVAGCCWLWWRHRRNRPLFAPVKEVVPPYTLAIRTLDGIKERKLWQPGQEKEYYTCLTDALRRYMDGELDVPAMEQTTAEIMALLAQCPYLEKDDLERMSGLLDTADFVKFARHMPLQDENARYLEQAYAFINGCHGRVEARKAEEAEARKRQEEAEKEEKTAAARTGQEVKEDR